MKITNRFKFTVLCAAVLVSALVATQITKTDADIETPNEVKENNVAVSSQEVMETNVEKGYLFSVDSQPVFAVADEKIALQLKEELISKAGTYYGVSSGCSLINTVEITAGEFDKDCFLSTEEARTSLGIDAFFSQPEVTTLSGEKIVISVSELSIVTEYVETDFETVYTYTYGVNKSYENVVSEGEKGVIKRVYETNEVDGKVVSEKLILENVVSDPVDRVVEVGVTPSMQLASAELAYFIKPYDGIVSSDYGYRYLNGYEVHTGIDLIASNRGCYGDVVVSAADGVVEETGYSGGAGKYVVIRHEYGFSTVYMHFSEILVSEGDVLKAGDPVGEIGATGRVTGPHLHFEIRLNGEHTDPENYLKFE